ncbi:hypothetical protein J437_LFUL010576 [Ladona fulva]|uniref:Uncharacterized protein n=1 Tax=Ladona fulva TaxID=123851 RepID=A0A8K0P2N2_LADFU|nr:hypothetical protein J437_LFUL010576 [Ladona fulva]
MVFPFKLKSFCAYYVSYGDCIDRQTIFLNDILFEHFMEKIWVDSGELSNQWENFWPHSTSRMNWMRDIQVSPDFPKFISNVKNAILSTSVFPAFNHELKATDLIIYVESSSLPVIQKLAPKVERLTIEVSPSSEMVDNIISSLPGLTYLVELNLVSVHLCRNNAFLNNFWVIIRSLEALKKLAVDTCAITGLKMCKLSNYKLYRLYKKTGASECLKNGQ